MKQIIFTILLIFISSITFSQQNNPAPALTKEDYLAKSKRQKTVAWILLGGGIALTATGFAIEASTGEVALVSIITTGQPDESFVAGGVCFVIGVASMLASIPVFIISSKNKKTGMSISFKNERIIQLNKNSFVYRAVPSLSLRISL